MTTVPHLPGIYGLFCACPGCRITRPGEVEYVGQTRVSMRRRFKAHLNVVASASPSRKHLLSLPVYRWISKHGVENIRLVALEFGTEGLDERETFWIEHLETSSPRRLNVAPGGVGNPGKHSEESRQKMKDNFRDNPERARSISRPGERHSLATFTNEEVGRVKERLWRGESATEIANSLNIPVHRIQQINTGTSWLDVPWPIGPRVRPRHRSILTFDQRQEIHSMRGQGMSYRKIGELLGISATVAHRAVNG